MKMYVSTLLIGGEFRVHSPDLNVTVTVPRSETSTEAEWKSVVAAELEGKAVNSIPMGRYPVILSTRQLLRRNGCSIESFLDCVPITFNVEKDENGIQRITSAH